MKRDEGERVVEKSESVPLFSPLPLFHFTFNSACA